MAFAQQPYQYRPAGAQPATFGSPYPSQTYTGPSTGAATQWSNGQGMPATPTAGGLPSGYRLAGGSRQAPPPAAERTGPAGSAGGKVMYFRKSADALAPDAAPNSGGVTPAAGAELPPVAPLPDLPLPTPSSLPTAPPIPFNVTERPVPAPTPPALPPVVSEAATPGFESPVQSQVKPKAKEEKFDPKIPPEVTRVPPWKDLSQMYDDATLRQKIYERTGQELKRTPEEVARNTPFPLLTPVVPPGTAFVPKTASLPPGRMLYEPGFVIHRRLHFEEKNSERYGWDLGIIQPFVSTMAFYKDTLLLPNSLASGLEVGFFDTNMGKCVPGSPTPYYLYPPGLTMTGVATELGLITGGAFILHPVGAGNLAGPFIH